MVLKKLAKIGCYLTNFFPTLNCLTFTLFLLESDANRDAAKRDGQHLNNKLNELTEETRVREKDFQMAIDDARRNEMKSLEKIKNLENLLDNRSQVRTSISTFN